MMCQSIIPKIETVNNTTNNIVLFYEYPPILSRPFLHRFLIAQAKAFLMCGFKVIFCTGDDVAELNDDFLDKYIPNAVAVKASDIYYIKPTVVFTATVNSVLRFIFHNMLVTKKYNKILWYGGILPEERYLKNNNIFKKLVLIGIEQFALRWSDIILLPSDYMQIYLKNHKRLPPKKYLTVPNAIESIPPIYFETRALWGIEDHVSPVIGYCGGIYEWQCFEDTARLISQVQCLYPEIWFLVLTYEQEKAQKILQEHNVYRYVVKSCNSSETHQYLQAFDLGMLLRRPHPINAVSFPLKYVDYIANGVPVCTTAAIDSISEDAENNHGLLIDLDRYEPQRVLDHILQSMKDRQSIRERLRMHASKKWTWESINAECRQIYTKMLNS